MPSKRSSLLLCTFLIALNALPLFAEEKAARVIDLWPGKPPGEAREVGKEGDVSKPGGNLIAGRTVIRLGNVATPQLHLFLPPPEKRNGSAVVICPGGGYQILAWDLEGTEVAEWFNSQGVTALVLKHRVPGLAKQPSLMAVQDAQRALSLTRAKAAEWKLDPQRIGVVGFSAGGHCAAHVTIQNEKRLYDAVDDADQVPFRPDFGVFVYPGYIVNDKTGELNPEFVVSKDSPPTFFVHALDDGVKCENSVQLFRALQKAGAASELHIYDAGGHGYGLRPQPQFPVTTWPQRCAEWLGRRGLLAPLKPLAP